MLHNPFRWSVGQGGAVSIGYICNGCCSQTALLETSAKNELVGSNEVSIAAQVALCYLLQNIEVSAWHRSSQLASLSVEYRENVPKCMVDKICEDAKNDIRNMDHCELGFGVVLSHLPMACR